jgi:Concanavalin A-like lectin/glucanases superfamily
MPTSENTGTERYALVFDDTGNEIEFWIRTTTDDSLAASFSAAGSWAHVVGVFNNDVMRVYINGALAAGPTNHTGSGGISAHSNGGIQIGRYGPTFGQYFNGKIDDVRVYSRALSADEIKQLYQMGQQ